MSIFIISVSFASWHMYDNVVRSTCANSKRHNDQIVIRGRPTRKLLLLELNDRRAWRDIVRRAFKFLS